MQLKYSWTLAWQPTGRSAIMAEIYHLRMTEVIVLDPAVGHLLALAYALLFVHASWLKWLDLRRFTATLVNYRLLPAPLPALLGKIIPVLETGAAGALLYGPVRILGVTIGAVLLLIYAAAIGTNMARGRLDLDCGCTGPAGRRPIALWMVVRNIVLAGGLVSLAAPWIGRPLVAVDGLTISGGACVLVLLYLSMDTLFAQLLPAVDRLKVPL